MSNFTVPYTFVGGTKARAEEINSNFSAVKDELNIKVDKNDNGTVVVGTATESSHAVNKGQIESILATALTSKADNNLSNLSTDGHTKLQCEAYSVNKGNVNSNGEPDLIDYTINTKIVFKVNDNNPLMGTLADGSTFTRTSIPDLSVSALSNGTYNLFIGESGDCIPLANTIYRQKNEPVGISEVSWTQPVLSTNGTVGGSSFAVNATSPSSYPIWKAFDGSTSTQGAVTGSGTKEIIIYNPTAIKITNFAIYNGNAVATQVSSGGAVYGSNNGSTYTLINNYTNTNKTATSTWNINLSGNSNYYKYYKLTYTGIIDMASTQNWYIGKITITAKQQTVINLTNSVWLNTSKIPYISKKYNGSSWISNNYVPLPQTITVSSGTITAVNKSRNYNDNGYDKYLTLPDFSRNTTLTSGSTYTATLNGWIYNGSALVKPLYIGETYTPTGSGYTFYAMRGE